MRNLKHNYTVALFGLMLVGFSASCSKDKDTESDVSTNTTTTITQDTSAYITKVYDYVYAPGQFASVAYSASASDFVGVPSYLSTATTSKNLISLGGWGGYIIAGFNHNITNVSGNDFVVFCGSSSAPEPGVVYVMEDTNGNGLPDDTWYELKGSEFSNASTYRNYTVTYYKAKSDSANVTWKDSNGNTGSLVPGYGNTYSSGWWKYPLKDSLAFTGTRLPDAYYNSGSSTSQNWVVYSGLFTWGYAENATGTDYNSTYKGDEFDISNAVDASGNAVKLTSIRFIKVQTGIFQQAGWLNEISTEVYGAADLSMLK
jgi:hypothetical protein